MTTEKHTATITYYTEDGKTCVHTDLPDEAEALHVSFVYMNSLVSILRITGYEDEEIPDIVRESLRAAMTGMSELKAD